MRLSAWKGGNSRPDRWLGFLWRQCAQLACAAVLGLTGCGGGEPAIAPTIISQPADQIVQAGTSATFSAEVSGAPAPVLQWQLSSDGGINWSDITGATASHYTTPALSLSDDGKYFRLLAANAAGRRITTAARLTVQPAAAGVSCTGPGVSGWCIARQPPNGPAGDLNAVARVTDTDVIAVGDGGRILRSTDAGLTWTSVDSGTTQRLIAVAFANDRYGLIASGVDTILMTTDGGRSWRREQPAFWDPLLHFAISSMAAPAESAGVMGNGLGVLGYRSNGGAWSAASVETEGSFGATVRGIAFATALKGVAVGVARGADWSNRAAVYRTFDGGRSWRGEVLPDVGGLFAVAYGDESQVVAVGFGPYGGDRFQTLLRSDDGGATWQRLDGLTRASLFGVAFAGPQQVVAVGEQGTVLRSVDGGRSWSHAAAGTTEAIHGVAFVNDDIGVAVGTGGTILRTTDGGSTWSTIIAASHPAIGSVDFAGQTGAVAVSEAGQVLRSTDRGFTWHTSASFNLHFASVAFASPKVGFATGRWRAETQMQTFLGTGDGGDNWSAIGFADFQSFESIAFVTPEAAAVVGAQGALFRLTIEGRPALTPAVTPPIETACATPGIVPASCVRGTARAVAFADFNVGVAVGTFGLILRTTDAGATWDLIANTRLSGTQLNAVAFAGSAVGVAVGNDGAILRTADGGRTWMAVDSGSGEHLYGVSFAAAEHGQAVGANGTILRTTNGGLSWVPLASGTTNDLFAVKFRDALHGLATGANGTILATVTGGTPRP